MLSTSRKLPTFCPSEILSGRIPPADFHLHTSFTDGTDTVESCIRSALGQGLKTIAFSEHVSLSEERLNAWFQTFLDEVDRCRQAYPEIEIYTGVEAKVLDYEGNLNVPQYCIESVDFLMGVVHTYPGEASMGFATNVVKLSPDAARATELRASLAVLENPQVSVIGHVGAVYSKYFGQLPLVDFNKVIEKAAERGVAFEVNARYHKTFMKDLLALCVEHRASVTLGSDAHTPESVGEVVRLLRQELGK